MFVTKILFKRMMMSQFCNAQFYLNRYDLLPFYSRMVATLYPCMPDVATNLVQLLKSDFRWHVSIVEYCTSNC